MSVGGAGPIGKEASMSERHEVTGERKGMHEGVETWDSECSCGPADPNDDWGTLGDGG